MEKIAFYDAKPYDREWFDRYNTKFEIEYFVGQLRPENAKLAEGSRAVCAFVNDNINEKTIDILARLGVEVILLRCAGFNNVDIAAAKGKLRVLRVPAYSPYAVAEHAMGLILALNRKIPRQSPSAYRKRGIFRRRVSAARQSSQTAASRLILSRTCAL